MKSLRQLFRTSLDSIATPRTDRKALREADRKQHLAPRLHSHHATVLGFDMWRVN